MTKTELIALMNLELRSQRPIRAIHLRSFLEQLIDVLYAVIGFTTEEITLAGTTYQNNVLIDADIENFALFHNGMELTTSIGSSFDDSTGTITFATSKTGSAKFFYR